MCSHIRRAICRFPNGNIHNSVCHLLTRPNENPELDIDQDFLLERVLRKHPNVIGVGEIRAAAECMSVSEASRTGHTCLTTIHSNSGESSYKRMMTLAKRKFQMADEILLQIMVEAFPIIVYTKQLDDGSRKIMEIIEGEDFINGKTVTRTLFRYDVLDNKREAFMMMWLVIVNIPLLYAINRDWFMTLVYSLQGKITLAVCAAIVLFSFVRIMKLSAPIEYKGG